MILNDTDHLWGIGGNHQWVWRSFCRGLNPLFMDPCSPPIEADNAGASATWTDHLTGKSRLDPKWDPIRKNMGYTLQFAQKIDLAHCLPHNELASSQYCLANPDTEYLVYLPQGGEVTVDLSAANGEFQGEWFDPSRGKTAGTLRVKGGGKAALKAPFAGDAVLYLRR